MPRRPKKPWNANGIDWAPHPERVPDTSGVTVGHSTPALPEEWHVVDETGAPYVVAGGHPWVGSERRAKLEAERLTRETGRQHEARRVR